MPGKIVAVVFVLMLSLAAVPGFAAQAAAPAQTEENLLFLDKAETLRLAEKVEMLLNETLEGVSGGETFVYVNAQWLQLVLNAAMKQALVLEFIYEQNPGAGGKSIMEVMARDANELYLSYLDYNLKNINDMIAVYAGAGEARITALCADLAAIHTDAANLYRDMENRRARHLSGQGG